MRKRHPENERIKHRYMSFLKEAKRLSEESVDAAAAAIAGFEESTGHRDFRRFHIEQARRFKRELADQVNAATGRPLAKATIHARLMAVKAFIQWLASEPGYRSRIRYPDAEYFNPSANDGRIARAARERPAPSLEQIRHVLATMPAETDIQRRDRALIAFAILTGARDAAIASFSLKHVDVRRRLVFQEAREVRTKRAKTFSTYFFPVGAEIEAIVTDWIDRLRTTAMFGDDDPLFPSTAVTLDGHRQFRAAGLTRKHWSGAGPIRRIFRDAFEAAGEPYYHPHSFRKTLGALAQRMCATPEQFKAWSQNLGHEEPLVTFTSYGEVTEPRQAELMARLRESGRAEGPTPLKDQATHELLMEISRRLAP